MTENDIKQITLQDLHNLFAIYEQLDADHFDEFLDYFWNNVARARTHPTNQCIDKVVHYLEDYKRRLGEAYNNARKAYKYTLAKSIKDKYNDIEDQIRELVVEYEVHRKYKPYKL